MLLDLISKLFTYKSEYEAFTSYLAKSSDLADLERRMKQVDRTLSKKMF